MSEHLKKNKEIPVTRSSMPSYEEYCDEIRELWNSRWLTNAGIKHNELKKELEQYLSVPFVEPVANGHSALELAIQALGLKGEIITTPFTFVSTTHAIARSGCRPVFCDIDPDNYTMNVDQIEQLITDKTTAILPVHVYGNPCDVERIQEIADKHHLKVIYDAAHAFGVRYKGKGIASFGDISCFSFHATKVFHTIEGGAICTKNSAVADEIEIIRDFGIADAEHVEAIAPNAKMNEFSAAMGICNLRHINEEIEKRHKVYDRYMQNLSGMKGLKLNTYSPDVQPNYAYFPVLITDEFGHTRDEVFHLLADHNIHARKYFYPISTELECYRNQFDSSLTPVALKYSKEVLTLPFYADLSFEDVDRICSIIKSL